ncbi:PH domain-like protein [Hymenopellis radicata]|nr:PH domain-like protein [Hymenopellis radicata]
MRGLNRTFLKQLGQMLEDDPFINLADRHFDTYKKYLLVIETERKTAEAAAAERSKPAAPTFSKTFGVQSATPASSPFSFPPPKSTTSSTEPAKGFSFPPPNGATFKPSVSAATPLNSPFGAATSGASSSSLASPFGSTTTPSPFGTSTAPASSSSPFGGGFKPSASLTFGASSTSKDSETPSKPTATQAPSDFFATPPASAKGGGPLSGFGGFKATGSIGNPVGFGFGASSSSKSDETEKSTEAEGGSSQETASTSTDGDAMSNMIGTSVHDVEGEGEEDEETTYSVKLKAFKMTKDNEGKSSWAELGVGFLRLKKHKETSARRMLLRNSSSGKIHINFNLYGNLKPILPTKKSISFIGHDEHGAAQSYLLRTKVEEQTTELKNALDREIAFVKAKEL